MSDTTPQRVHQFHHSHLLATIEGPTGTPEAFYTLEDGTVVQAISYLTVTHTDGTSGLDVQVVPVSANDRSHRARRPRRDRRTRTTAPESPDRTVFAADS